MRLARLLVAVATVALLVLVIVLITGGFTVHLGPLSLTSHHWRGPLLIVLAMLGGAACTGRGPFVGALSSVWAFVDAHAAAMAVVLATVAIGAGVAHGTYAASSSDASGYVSEARLLASGSLVTDEPLARQVTWPTGTWAVAPLGYRPGATVGELVPTYPAGLPLWLALMRLIGGELALYIVVPLLGALAVLCTYVLGARLHSRSAGVAAASLLATSPIFLFQLVQPMSDVAATAWWGLALVFASSSVPAAPVAAGAAAGLAVLTRPNLLPLVVLVAITFIKWPWSRRDRAVHTRQLFALAVGIAPALGALLLVQWRLYGSPLISGYGAGADLFDVGNIVPNLSRYANRIVQGEGPVLGLTTLAGVIVLARSRGGEAAGRPMGRPVVLAAVAGMIVAASYLPYAVFAEWSYLRFLLPAFPIAFVAIGALLAHAMLRLPSPIRGVAFLTALTIVCSLNVVRAEREQAFNLRRYESRYRLAGLYLNAVLPRNAVIVTVQQSGSARYYTDTPILRWDLMGVDLETALAALQSAGKHPFLLVEDWEAPGLRMKFPTSTTALLDWPPRAEFGDETRVRLFDPTDRNSLERWPVDRVH